MAECKGCGATIEWLLSPSGARLPAQKIATVYEKAPGDEGRLESLANPPRGFYVSHFATCPQAGQFSRGGKNG